MEAQNHWHWQEPGKAWKGVGIYHVTLTVPSREPLLGTLVIPDKDPMQAYIQRTELGEAIVHTIFQIQDYHPEVRVLQFCLMPDHIHVILYVTSLMPKGIGFVVRGWWQGVKKVYASSVSPNTIRDNERSSVRDNERSSIRDNERCFPVFTEMPFIRPLSRSGQLHAMIRYVQMNPQRLATKRLMPGFFCVQEGIEIAGRKYSGVGNISLLYAERYAPVHVRSIWVNDFEQHGDNAKLRDYMNSCVLAARQGTVMVSPFISQYEKAVQEVLLKEGHPFILLADNGFRDYYKPADGIFDAVAAGRVLILSPWEYDAQKKHVSRAECVAMNKMAEEIAEECAAE